jgi:hypothetical protein
MAISTEDAEGVVVDALIAMGGPLAASLRDAAPGRRQTDRSGCGDGRQHRPTLHVCIT